MPPRVRVPKATQQAAYKRQVGRCALCTTQHPLHIHHIVPVAAGGSNNFDNLVLLCANHHDLADLGIVDARILKRYRDSGEATADIADPTLLYELRVGVIAECLRTNMDPELLDNAKVLVSRFRRVPGSRYKKMCLELLDAMLASAALHDPNLTTDVGRGLRRQFAQIREGLTDHESSLLAARVEHHTGLLLHAAGRYDDALDTYQRASDSLRTLEPRDDVISELRTIDVHRGSALHLGGRSEAAQDLTFSVVSSNAADYAGVFAGIKLAEHRLVRSDSSDALTRLSHLLSASATQTPLLEVMILKGIATIHHDERSDDALATAVAALLLCKKHGLSDQARQIRARLGGVGEEAARYVASLSPRLAG